jgi:hypothetical protein
MPLRLNEDPFRLRIPVRNAMDGHLTVSTPAIPELPIQVFARAYFGASGDARARTSVNPPAASTRALVVRPPVQLVAPARNALTGPDGEFIWADAEPGGVYALTIGLSQGSGVTLYTTATRVSFRELAAFNHLVGSTQVSWYIESLGGARSVDDVVSPPGMAALRDESTTLSARSYFQVESGPLTPPD